MALTTDARHLATALACAPNWPALIYRDCARQAQQVGGTSKRREQLAHVRLVSLTCVHLMAKCVRASYRTAYK